MSQTQAMTGTNQYSHVRARLRLYQTGRGGSPDGLRSHHATLWSERDCKDLARRKTRITFEVEPYKKGKGAEGGQF